MISVAMDELNGKKTFVMGQGYSTEELPKQLSLNEGMSTIIVTQGKGELITNNVIPPSDVEKPTSNEAEMSYGRSNHSFE